MQAQGAIRADGMASQDMAEVWDDGILGARDATAGEGAYQAELRKQERADWNQKDT